MSDVFPGAAKPAVLAVLNAARRRNYGMTRMKLAKLLYLCDLEAVRRGGSPFTGITWRWLNYGPYNHALRDVEDELVRDGHVQRSVAPDFYGNRTCRLRVVSDFPGLPDDAAAVVEEIVGAYGKLAPTTLKDETYQTEPMITAQELGERGVVLDLLEARPVPDIAPAMRRLRAVRDRLDHQDTDPEAWDEIREDMRALAAPRRSATSKMLEE